MRVGQDVRIKKSKGTKKKTASRDGLYMIMYRVKTENCLIAIRKLLASPRTFSRIQTIASFDTPSISLESTTRSRPSVHVQPVVFPPSVLTPCAHCGGAE